MTEDKTQSVSHTLRFHGNQYDGDTLKASEAPLQTLVRSIIKFSKEIIGYFRKYLYVKILRH